MINKLYIFALVLTLILSVSAQDRGDARSNSKEDVSPKVEESTEKKNEFKLPKHITSAMIGKRRREAEKVKRDNRKGKYKTRAAYHKALYDSVHKACKKDIENVSKKCEQLRRALKGASEKKTARVNEILKPLEKYQSVMEQLKVAIENSATADMISSYNKITKIERKLEAINKKLLIRRWATDAECFPELYKSHLETVRLNEEVEKAQEDAEAEEMDKPVSTKRRRKKKRR